MQWQLPNRNDTNNYQTIKKDWKTFSVANTKATDIIVWPQGWYQWQRLKYYGFGKYCNGTVLSCRHTQENLHNSIQHTKPKQLKLARCCRLLRHLARKRYGPHGDLLSKAQIPLGLSRHVMTRSCILAHGKSWRDVSCVSVQQGATCTSQHVFIMCIQYKRKCCAHSLAADSSANVLL